MQQDKYKRAYRYQFESLNELYRWLDETAPKWNSRSSRSASEGHSWDLGASWDDAMYMARAGWVEGAQAASRSLKSFKEPERLPTVKRGVVGFRPSVPAYLAGSPRCMVQKANNGTPKKPTVRLVVQVDGSAAVNAQSMANIGAAIAQYIKTQEARGVRVEVWGAMGARGWSLDANFSWCVKRATQPLDIAVLAFSIGHPAMLRRIGFAMLERCDAPEMSGYGGIMDVTPDMLINAHPNAKYINGMSRANSIAATPEAAWDWLAKQVEAI